MELKYAPFNSAIHPGFWSAFSKLKLEVLGLAETAVDVHGLYENKDQPGLPARMNVEWDAFDASNSKLVTLNWSTFSSVGSIINYNTMEAFKTFDKTDYLNNTEGCRLYEAMTSSDQVVLEDPRLLTRFVVHMFADLKKYHYYYWFAFPAFILPDTVKMTKAVKPFPDAFSPQVVKDMAVKYGAWKKEHPAQSGFFWLEEADNTFMSLKGGMDSPTAVIGFADPSSLPEYPGWPLRNLLAFIGYVSPAKLKKGLKVICLRQRAIVGGEISIESSIVLQVQWQDCNDKLIGQQKCTGWEKSDKNQFGPRLANMRSSMDPKSLAESSVDLNLKLMKWRLVPSLDLQGLARTKCLLLGSGTLGCNVARCLLGWGVRHITFVDNGKVSYSNPVRQSLFTFDDCLDGGKPKAQAASAMLTKIFPGVTTNGHELNIPMPGHPISESFLDKVRQDYIKLEELIKAHDVIYLLMDTRESRWLPSVMAAHYGKLVINAALGFDTFLVMRHGLRDSQSWGAIDAKQTKIAGNQLGCYFCNDVVAPGNSTKDRTLDQQCTVTRPGVSYHAAAMAVELMASVLQHPLGAMAPASNVTATSEDDEGEGPLGRTVHSIRGSISNFQFHMPTTQRFPNCTACSREVLDSFAASGFELLHQTSKNSKHLEDLTGLSSLMSETNFEDIIECSDDDDF